MCCSVFYGLNVLAQAWEGGLKFVLLWHMKILSAALPASSAIETVSVTSDKVFQNSCFAALFSSQILCLYEKLNDLQDFSVMHIITHCNESATLLPECRSLSIRKKPSFAALITGIRFPTSWLSRRQ